AGLRAMDVAKRLLDYGIYAPTVYFPTTVPEALMFEPTETESRQSLDLLADVCTAIVADAERDLAFVQSSPHNTPVERVDEVTAARRPVRPCGDALRTGAAHPTQHAAPARCTRPSTQPTSRWCPPHDCARSDDLDAERRELHRLLAERAFAY